MTTPRPSRATTRTLPDALTSEALASIVEAILGAGCDTLAADDNKSVLHEPSIRAARAFARQLRAYTAPENGDG